MKSKKKIFISIDSDEYYPYHDFTVHEAVRKPEPDMREVSRKELRKLLRLERLRNEMNALLNQLEAEPYSRVPQG